MIVVPTRSAAAQLRGADAVTRDELYDRFHGRLAAPPRRLTALEREVIAQAAARAAAERTPDLVFKIRPGLVAEMLRFYDQLRRQSQQVDRFEELIDMALGGDEFDRGAARMRTQTRFLADAFREYERRVRESSGCDEHTLRARLIAEPAVDPVRHVIVTVPDWIADADGLYVADFDLLTRIPGLEALDIICTERVLRTGFDERLHNWWPGLETIAGLKPCATSANGDAAAENRDAKVAQGFSPANPVLITPPGAPPDQPWWTVRDREEELVAIARHIRADQRRGEAAPLDRTAVVFKHPLPYLYLADEVFRSAGIPYAVSDALPLAAQPESAALDLVLEAVASTFTRGALVALLRSPHFSFGDVTRESIAALDVALSKARYLGDPDRLPLDTSTEAMPALEAARLVTRELAPLSTARPASQQARVVRDFWIAHPPSPESGFGAAGPAAREQRARAAIAETLAALEAVHATFDDPDWTIAELAPAVRRFIEDQTFAPERARNDGVQLLDDQAVRYGAFDDIAIVGLVDPDWPEPPRRNIFYPPSLLKALGWPSEKDRRAAADARFIDLLGSASRRTTLFTFTLDEEALVSRSLQLDEVARARLSTVARTDGDDARVFDDEALADEAIALDALGGELREWAQLRTERTAADAPEFHGSAGTREARPWSVSAVETYINCPFRFFAQHVLRLEEEPDDEEVMDPKQQGILVHRVFERFFAAWQDAGHRAVTPQNLDAARALFESVVDRELASLPTAEAGLERTRLLGSSAAAGLGEAVLRMEAERPVPVVRRLLEHRLEGTFVIQTANSPRTIALKGKADRVDLLDDGTFRLIDYKLGWPPKGGRALQLPIYSICSEQRLAGVLGRTWTLGEAAYVAFKGPKRVVPLFAATTDRAKVLAEAQQRLADAIDAIERGEFPPHPEDVWHCDTCAYAAVCRKDYVGDV